MPSKQDVDTVRRNVLCKNNESDTTQEFLSRDVENLVYEIKENLRLSGLKMRHRKRPRPSPYSHTSRSNLSDLYGQKTPCDDCIKNGIVCSHGDDPYEMLQDLLRDGSLIKEAVRRLQRDYISPKQQQKYVYDSDDETVAKSPFRFYRNLEI